MLAGLTVRVSEIGKTGAAMIDGGPQDLPCRPGQRSRLPASESAAPPRGMQPRPEQRLAGIDVAYSGDSALVEKE